MPDTPFRPADGGCACGAVRFRVLREPLFVHCCHCTRCQRETGGPFAHHAMVEFSAMDLLQGEPVFVKVPTDSGNTHWVVRCPQCSTALWNEHGSRRAATRYVRVGTFDEPARFAPRAHIYVRSRQSWLELDAGTPAFAGYYDTAATWPPASLQRWAAARAARVGQRTEALARRVQDGASSISESPSMNKGQRGNKEAKKPKKVFVPNPPGLPESLAPKVALETRPKKR